MPQSPYISGAYCTIKNTNQEGNSPYLTAPGSTAGLATFQRERSESASNFPEQQW
ncbi:hypothetical protein ACFWD7_50305 [Streptomyces mirabilis]|uniref:hypothetical protein n=1 Tax=Streptomyces mirabilis TaxID=68239 RepID=UPI0021BE9516|nr:hypothetical protein [Streptomyces mirabilis]MCT9113822.1 hypothetical protein [Streptomyces mirabilis]